METLESLRGKLDSAADIDSVVRTMKAVAASNIGQYEQSVAALTQYYQTITMGLVAYFRAQKWQGSAGTEKELDSAGIIVFGSDQGLVGRFNDSLTEFVTQSQDQIPPVKEVWAVGERISLLMQDEDFNCSRLFSVPNGVNAITPLVGEILLKVQESIERGEIKSFYIFHNQPKKVAGFIPVKQRLLPLDKKWQQEFQGVNWPTNKLPQVVGNIETVLMALIREFLFVSLFRACAESLASENASRLNSMQRAEKNIEELLDELHHTFHRLRQSTIDEELFDVVAGFEALKQHPK
ncbi:MAG: F0F1 ATP synthase subunit gamma [Salegentibacter sp.]